MGGAASAFGAHDAHDARNATRAFAVCKGSCACP